MATIVGRAALLARSNTRVLSRSSQPLTPPSLPLTPLQQILGKRLHSPSSRGTAQRAAWGLQVRAMSSSRASLVDLVKEKNDQYPVIVYSKSYCPYCAEVKGLFKSLKVDAKIVELDDIVEGDEIQDALHDITRRRTVPQVFIQGKFVGGCDDTIAEYNSGDLRKRFEAAGISSSV
ncbi:hypothetical protein WJX72_007897 [[Myrmecia] bisecta]|uniref:Glutaredoxin domain-containing protein n=1 Tax=[Myrmecia] bisecta TaxID=41462 RepID=A0AAW1QFW6_9CHLO